MEKTDVNALTNKLDEIEFCKVEIDAKLLEDAKIRQEKLKTQNDINDFIDSLKVVENYKTIKKSIACIQEKLTDAKKKNILIDIAVTERAIQQMGRLEKERNLNF